MCFPRKASLGRYSGNRKEWLRHYRAARVSARAGVSPDPACAGLDWKAQLIVHYERDRQDELSVPAANRLAVSRLIDEVLASDDHAS
ncbi:MAG: hypothetical protein R3260_00045 [Pseudomonas sp.]|nr:hypothetical protein [Pseudomonas sp.]